MKKGNYKCGKCGELGHNARSCTKSASAKKRKPKSWIKAMSDQLETAADKAVEEMNPEGDLPKGKGDPFADLPALSVPSTDSPDEGATPANSSEGPAAQSAPTDQSETTSTKSESKSTGSASADADNFDNTLLVQMAGKFGEDAMEASARYCAERGFFAFGGPMSKLVGKSCEIIAAKQLKDAQVSSEEGAAYVVAIFGGTNALQTYRAYADDKKKEREKKIHEQRATAAASQAQHVQNGVNVREQAQRAAEQQRAVSPGIV